MAVKEKPFRVMRAATLTKPVKFPVLASPKIDGIRAIVRDGVLMTQSLKSVPNKFIQSSVNWAEYEGLDGELVVGPANANNVMQATQSGVMSEDGEPDWYYYVFDLWNCTQFPYEVRLDKLLDMTIKDTRLLFLPQYWVRSVEDLSWHEERALACGYEGVMLRNPNGLYKHGRSTEKEGYLIKVKRFKDAEALITGAIPLMSNTNTATTNTLGLTERSSAKAGLVAKDMLGAFSVVNAEGIEFDVGTGFTEAQREEYWQRREELIGQTIKYKYFQGGVKVAPRFPVFLGFRYD